MLFAYIAVTSTLLLGVVIARPTPITPRIHHQNGGIFEPFFPSSQRRSSRPLGSSSQRVELSEKPALQLALNAVNPKLVKRSQLLATTFDNPKLLVKRSALVAPSFDNPKLLVKRSATDFENVAPPLLVATSLQAVPEPDVISNPKAFIAGGAMLLEIPNLSIENPKLPRPQPSATVPGVMLIAQRPLITPPPILAGAIVNPKNPKLGLHRTTTTLTLTATTTKTLTTTALPSATAVQWPTGGGLIASAYFTDWTVNVLPPSLVDMSLFDLIQYAFLLPTASYNIAFGDPYSGPGILTSLVGFAHAKNTKVIISIGGWTDSNLFSNAVRTSSSRTTFANNIAAFVTKYKLDGVDIDWEYPGTAGAPGNVVAPSDTANLLLLFVLLRAKLGPSAYLTSTSSQTAFAGPTGRALIDVSGFAAVLDAILIMNYDVWGSSSNPGPNAPLSNACPNSYQPGANAVSAIAAWTAAGMPANKLLLGIPSYGYVSSSTATTLVNKRGVLEYKSIGHQAYDKAKAKRALDARARQDERERVRKSLGSTKLRMEKKAIIFCPGSHSNRGNRTAVLCPGVTGQNISEIPWSPIKVTTLSNGTIVAGDNTGVFQIGPGTGVGKLGTGDLSGLDGNIIEFYQLVSYGLILAQGTEWVGVNGYTRAWDSCSAEPYLYDVRRAVVVTYDDPLSLNLKGALALNSGLAGMGMWDMTGDTANWILVKAWRSGMGK